MVDDMDPELTRLFHSLSPDDPEAGDRLVREMRRRGLVTSDVPVVYAIRQKATQLWRKMGSVPTPQGTHEYAGWVRMPLETYPTAHDATLAAGAWVFDNGLEIVALQWTELGYEDKDPLP